MLTQLLLVKSDTNISLFRMEETDIKSANGHIR